MGTRVTAVGRNTAIGTTRTDLWNVGGKYVFPPAPQQMSIVSTSANDTFAGTGIQVIVILYLDDQYNQQLTTVNLNGLTPVLTTPTNILRVNKVFSGAIGSGGSAAGNITISNGANTYARIDATYTASRSAIGTIPANMYGFITDLVFTCQSNAGGGTFCEVDLRSTSIVATLLPGIFTTISTFGTIGGGLVHKMDPPQIIPPTADVKISCSLMVGTGTVTAAGSFSGYLTGTVLT